MRGRRITAADLGRRRGRHFDYVILRLRPVRADGRASEAGGGGGKSHCVVERCAQCGEGRHNPRRTTSPTPFIVAPMYPLIKHRIDLSAPPGKISFLIIAAARSTTPASRARPARLSESINSFTARPKLLGQRASRL